MWKEKQGESDQFLDILEFKLLETLKIVAIHLSERLQKSFRAHLKGG